MLSACADPPLSGFVALLRGLSAKRRAYALSVRLAIRRDNSRGTKRRVSKRTGRDRMTFGIVGRLPERAPGSSTDLGVISRRRELRAITTTGYKPLAVVEQHDVLAIRLTPKLAYAIEVHDAGAAHANELERIEPVRERGERLTDRIPHALRANAHGVA
jgi:hypothetical protein